MALKRLQNGRVHEMTDREIKRNIMNRLGLDPKSAADQHTYKKQLNLQYLKAKNYSYLQELEKPAPANENWLLTIMREQNGAPLTAQQAAIKATTSQNTQAFIKRIVAESPALTDTAIQNLEAQFDGFLNKNSYGHKERYEEFRTREVQTAFLVDDNGEIVAEYNLTAGEQLPNYIPQGLTAEIHTRRELRTDQSYSEVKAYLESLADELHKIQDSKIAANGALYGGGKSTRAKRRYVGS